MIKTTKYRLAEQALRIISGGTPTDDAQVTIQELEIAVAQAFAGIVRNRYFQAKNIGEQQINGDLIYSFRDVEVEKDTGLDLFFATLPSTTISLPFDMGIHQVSRMKDQRAAFVPLRNGHLALFNGLQSEGLEGRIGYYVENDRIYFVNMTVTNEVSTLLMKLVVPLSVLGIDDEVNIPDDIQAEIVSFVVQGYTQQQKTPHDETSDLNK
jgi:hypothetical protein